MNQRDTLDPVSVGDVVGDRYAIADRLGEGGMGVIFLATDQRAANRRVVLKFPKKNLLYTEGFRERFDAEIRNLVAFEHQSVVRVYDVGVHGDSPYMVLQYLSGGSLEQKIERDGPQSPTEVMEWLPRVAAALDSLHKQGIIHRDVKCANILFDGHGEVYLSDFGIVKVLTDLENRGTMRRDEFCGQFGEPMAAQFRAGV